MDNPFDDALEVEASAAEDEMGEPIEINGISAISPTKPLRGVVSPVDYTTALSMSLGGTTEKPTFTVNLTNEAVAACGAAKGSRVVTKKGVVAKVISTTDLGGGGLQLNCGPVQTRDI